MSFRSFALLSVVVGLVGSVEAQTRLKVSAIIPGSEHVQLVPNGDFQLAGPSVNGARPSPPGWSRQGEIFVGSGFNTVPLHESSVAVAMTNDTVALYRQDLLLEPSTAYVLSAYVWNFGDAANRMTAVLDLNDAPGEPQIVVTPSDSGADAGLFVYRSFNTTNTGTNVTLRIFAVDLVGAGSVAAFRPVAAQWDNLAVTKAADFVAPAASGSGANVRPIVRLVSPENGASLNLDGATRTVPVRVAALDLDGAVASVELLDGGTTVATSVVPPFDFAWSNTTSGVHRLGAVATDSTGASTRTAEITVYVAVPPEPVSLHIEPADGGIHLAWNEDYSGGGLQMADDVGATSVWKTVTNAPTSQAGETTVRLASTNSQQFFRLGSEVDPTTLTGKLMMGYQGWFAAPGDGSPDNRWVHWFRSQDPSAANATVDFWPDVSEFDPDELFPTGMTLPNGSTAKLFSSFSAKTVLRHFKWMRDYGLDGVFLQRFTVALGDPGSIAFRNRVAVNVRLGAETYGRTYAMMYDISGQSEATVVSTLTNDWTYLVNSLHYTESSQYLRHRGKPVVAIWGFGFTDRAGSPEAAQAAIQFFKDAGCTVMGGVPTHWRTLSGDSKTDPKWAAIYRSFDIISPWSVGRYGNSTEIDAFRVNQIVPDLSETKRLGLDYLPVVFPGFSWKNLNAGPLNQIPRRGGDFYWRQVFNIVASGGTMIYGAMFDEVDEGTAMFKTAPTVAEMPAQGSFVPLDIDGKSLPSDWYLRVAGEATKMLRKEIPLQSKLPISP